ncbi:MAG: hypothetical protein NUW37_14770 [Planctomycetes bacterium]|nr:hypothetical protein [Planctomycetota bacterium]
MKPETIRFRIARKAAMILSQGYTDSIGAAKKRAAQLLGVDVRGNGKSLPTDAEVRIEYDSILGVSKHEGTDELLFELRSVALEAMKALARFNPVLVGSLVTGNIGPTTDVNIACFSDETTPIEAECRRSFEGSLAIYSATDNKTVIRVHGERAIVIDIYPSSWKTRRLRSVITGEDLPKMTAQELEEAV